MVTMANFSVKLRLISVLLAAIVPENGHAQGTCTTHSSPPAVFSGFSLAVGERLLLSVRADTEPAKIQLLPSTTAIANGDDYYEIVLGRDDSSYPGMAGDGASIARLNSDALTTPTATDAQVPLSQDVVALTSTVYEDFYIQVSPNNDDSATIEIGYASDTSSFVSFTDPNPINDVSFVGVTTDGDWKVCETLPSIGGSVVEGDFGSVQSDLSDGNINTCIQLGGSLTPSGFIIYLDGEYEVAGVVIEHDETTTNFADAQVEVGNCGAVAYKRPITDTTATDIHKNVDCGEALSSGEESQSPVYRSCPKSTYGNLVFITKDTASAMELCDVTIFGRRRSDDDKTTVSFQSANYASEEEDADKVVTLTLIRSGQSEDNPTCTVANLISVNPTSSGIVLDGTTAGVCDSGEDIPVALPLSITFDVDDTTTKDFDVTICGDYTSEDTEMITLRVDETASYVACAGDLDTATLTITDNDSDYHFEMSTYRVSEFDQSVTLNIIRSGYTAAETTISIKTNDGANGDDSDAMQPMDYVQQTAGMTEITFAAGATSAPVSIDITNDQDGEIDEEFTVDIQVSRDGGGTWQDFTSASGGPTTATVTIVSDDPAFQLSEATYNGIETDGHIDVTIENIYAEALTQEQSVTLVASELTATEGSDFEPFSATQIFAVGETFKTVQVPIIDDRDVETSETFEITISSDTLTVVSGSETAELTIDDDDATVSMAVSSQDVSERDESVAVVINRANDEYVARAAWVDVQVLSETATAPEDYTVPNTLRAYFISGQDSTSITIPVVNDRDIEDDQTFIVQIVDADNPIDDTADTTTVTIQSDDALIYLKQTPNQVVEGETFVATVMRDGGEGFEHEVHVNTNSDGTNAATADTDFEVISTVLTFADDEDSKVVMVQTREDDELEETESFLVSISNPLGVIDETRSELNVEILDDDTLVGFEQILYEVTETTGSDTFVEVTLTRGGDISNPLSVVLSTVESNGAKAGDDFGVINSMTVTFPAEEDTVPLQITIEADDTPEFVETFQIIVRDTAGGMENIDPARSAADITITDDDSGSFRFDDTKYSVQEGQGFLSATILRPGSTAGYVDLLVTTSPITATQGDDYLQEEVRIQFSPGQDSATVQIAIVGDNDFQEGDETFLITLSVASDFGTVDPEYDMATVTIQDSQSTFSLTTTTPTVLESVPGYVEITIRRSGSTTTDALVSLQTVDGTATHSGDFKGFNLKTFVFPSGTTEVSFRIDIDNNDIHEDSEETFSVRIISADGIVLEDSSLTITIIDDDGYFSFAPTFASDDDDTDPSAGVVYYTTTEDGGPVTITVQRTGNANAYASVRATTVEDTADSDDYVPFDTRVIHFVPTQSTSEFTVTIENDEEREGDESFYVELSLPSNGVLIEPRKAKITIESNDRPAGGRPEPLSTNSVIGIAVGVGGIVIIAAIAGVAFFLLSRPTPAPAKPFPGPRPVLPAGFRPTPGVAPNPNRSQFYPQLRGYP